MYSLLTYPLGVISTNRMAGSHFAREASENLPKEFVSLYERGNMNRGMYRGFAPALAFTFFWQDVARNSREGFPVLSVVLGTLTLNAFAVMQTKRQIVNNTNLTEVVAYRKMASELGLKLVTLGATAHIVRNMALSIAFVPREAGNNDQSIFGLYALGSVLLSHPFEVARVMIVNNGSGNLMPTLRALYHSEGVAGLYRGFIPRAIHLVPPMMAVNYFINPKDSFHYMSADGFGEKQAALA